MVVDVAYFDVAFWVGGWDGSHLGGGLAGQRRRVGVEDDLVSRLDPGGIPFDDAGGLLPAGFGLPALIGVGGGDDVAGCVLHD